AEAALLGRELLYLDRLSASSPDSKISAQQVARCRRRLGALRPQQLKDLLDLGEGQQQASASSRGPRNADARRLQSGPFLSEDGQSAGIGHIASFLCPEKEPGEAEDEVRLLSAEGRLASELGKFPVLASTGTQSALVFRHLRSWSPEDDVEEQARDRLAVLELSQAAANLREIQDYIGAQVQADQPNIDAVEQDMASTQENTQGAMRVLADSTDLKSRAVLNFLAPSVGLVILGA
ncbi:unnamed protein product, partial [Polarella glacialis]